MAWSRRELLRLGASSLALAATRCTRRPPAAATAPPRHVVIVYLDGGIDPVLTLDPKRHAEVAAEVDVPYAAEEIAVTGPLSLGPHFAPLAPWASQMAIVKGVALDTANHNTGWGQVSRLRTRAAPAMPGILDIIGRHGDGQPLPTISFGDLAPAQYTPDHADGQLVFAIHDLGRERLEALGRSLRAEASELARRGADPRARRTTDNYRRVGQLAERLQDVPPFVPRTWGGAPSERTGRDLQRVLWAFEHDLARCAFIKVRPYAGWDSHNHNELRQRNCSRAFTDVFVPFLSELATRRNRHGTLAETTLLLVGSELGRFPRLNGNAGKDHFPQTAFLLLGAGVRPGVFGATDERMCALPLDPASGHPVTRGGHGLVLDDLGATMLAIAGIAPEPHGYTGRVLRWLIA